MPLPAAAAAVLSAVATTVAPFLIQKLGDWFFKGNKSNTPTKPTIKSNPAYSPGKAAPAGTPGAVQTKDGTATTRQGDWEKGYEDFVKSFTTATPEQQNAVKTL